MQATAWMCVAAAILVGVYLIASYKGARDERAIWTRREKACEGPVAKAEPEKSPAQPEQQPAEPAEPTEEEARQAAIVAALADMRRALDALGELVAR